MAGWPDGLAGQGGGKQGAGRAGADRLGARGEEETGRAGAAADSDILKST